MNDKISVIVPVYNAEKYLDKCLNSLRDQTYQNLEIICVNDGSTDGSLNVLREHADKDRRIRIICQENSGSATARNTGLEAATGDWITFTDNDDWLDPDMYEKLLSYGQNNPADILACGYYFDYPNREIEAVDLLPVPFGIQDMRSFLYYIYCRDQYKGVTSYIWNKLFHSSIIKKGEDVGIRFDETLGNLGDDIDWAARCYMQAKTISYLPNAMYHHRERPDSVFHMLDQRLQTMQHIQAYEKIIALFEENQIDKKVLDYVKRFYVYHLGVLMELAKKNDDKNKADNLRKKAIPYLDIYIQTNLDFPERIKWAKDLFL